MNDTILWYATRGAGAVSLLLLTAVVCLGIVTSLKWQSRATPLFLSVNLHRNLSLLSILFLALHIVTAVVDPFAHLGIIAALVPFSSYYRTFWLGLGVVALDLFLALILTSVLRARVGQRAWRAVHWLSYALWPIAIVHGIGTGTDSAAPWMLAVDAVCLLLVAGAVTWRVSARPKAIHAPSPSSAAGIPSLHRAQS